MTFGIKQICERFGVGEHTVLAWIRNGELAAINVARKPDGKPKWKITPSALEAFELLRTPSPPATTGRRRRKKTENVIEFYK